MGTGVETDGAGVSMVTADGGPEVPTAGTTVMEDDRVGTVLQDADRGHKETVVADDGDDSVVVLAAVIVCVTLCVILQCVVDVVWLRGAAGADFCTVTFGLRPRLPRAVRVLFPNMGLVRRELVERVCADVATGVFALLLLLAIMILACCCCDMVGNWGI